MNHGFHVKLSQKTTGGYLGWFTALDWACPRSIAMALLRLRCGGWLLRCTPGRVAGQERDRWLKIWTWMDFEIDLWWFSNWFMEFYGVLLGFYKSMEHLSSTWFTMKQWELTKVWGFPWISIPSHGVPVDLVDLHLVMTVMLRCWFGI